MPATTNILPTNQTKYWDRTGSMPIPTEFIITIMEPVVDPPVEIAYAQYQLNFENTSVNWLTRPDSEFSFIDISNDTGYLQLAFQNLDLLPNGNYRAAVIIELSTTTEYVRTIYAYVNLVLSGTSPTQITTDKSTYNLVYNRDTDDLTGDIAVGIVNNTDTIALKFWQNGSIFEDAENFTTGFDFAENPTLPMATNPALPETGSVTIGAKILKQTGEFVHGFSVNLVILDGGISVAPQSLAFEVFKGSSEKSAVLTITNPLGIDFEATEFPAWLSLDDTEGNTSQSITVTTDTASLAVGEHSGIIKFEFNSDFIEIPVTLSLKSFIIIDETVDFCLDLPAVRINQKTEGAKFLRITMYATYNVLGISHYFEKVYQVPYFLGVGRFQLGEKLHRHFPRIKQHFFEDSEVTLMQIIQSSIKVEELDSNLTVLFTEHAHDIRLFPGKKPAAYPLLSSALFRKKNKNAVIFTSEVVDETVILKKTDEEDFVNPLIIGAAEINFYDLPKSFAPVHVQWENQNLVPEWFTFTGDYKITPDFNHTYARNIFNAQNEKYDVSKLKTLTINTGMILAKERELLSEMIESRISFIKIEDRIYRCFNITKKNVELDSTEELIARDLEYLIVEQ